MDLTIRHVLFDSRELHELDVVSRRTHDSIGQTIL